MTWQRVRTPQGEEKIEENRRKSMKIDENRLIFLKCVPLGRLQVLIYFNTIRGKSKKIAENRRKSRKSIDFP